MRYECLILVTNVDFDKRNSTSFPTNPYDFREKSPDYYESLQNPIDMDAQEAFLRAWKMSRVLGQSRYRDWRVGLSKILTEDQDLIISLRDKDLQTQGLWQVRSEIWKLFSPITRLHR